jgi:hypothetical protein
VEFATHESDEELVPFESELKSMMEMQEEPDRRQLLAGLVERLEIRRHGIDLENANVGELVCIRNMVLEPSPIDDLLCDRASE